MQQKPASSILRQHRRERLVCLPHRHDGLSLGWVVLGVYKRVYQDFSVDPDKICHLLDESATAGRTVSVAAASAAPCSQVVVHVGSTAPNLQPKLNLTTGTIQNHGALLRKALTPSP